MLVTQPLSPWETFRSMASSLTLAEALWVTIGIGGVFLFYSVAISRRRSDGASWQKLLFWLMAVLGWAFIMYMVAWRKISAGGTWAVLICLAASIVVSFTVSILTRKARLWERIVSGSVIGIIGFGILATFGVGVQSWGYSLVMGLTLGVIIGMIRSAWMGLKATIDESIENLDAKRTQNERGRAKERKVTEI